MTFDEAQNFRNAIANHTSTHWGSAETETSLQGVACLEMQRLLPNSRVVYASATSASDIVSMGYAVRLGLWGKGTAFPTSRSFFEAMEKGGLNALELVARDLKAAGLYVAANFSFANVVFERLEYQLTPAERALWDRLADAWSQINLARNQALISTGIALVAKKVSHKTKFRRSFYFLAKARFFQAVLASIKMKPVIQAIRQDLAAGHACVLQLTNTFAANAERAIEEAEADSLNDVEATPRDILLEYIHDQFPIVVHHIVGHKGNQQLVPKLTASGAEMIDPAALAARDNLIDDIKQLPLPEGPFEQLFMEFGAQAVAEVTGRQRGLIPAECPASACWRNAQPRSASPTSRHSRETPNAS